MLLAIDTASRYISIALRDEHSLLAEQTTYTDNQHTVQLAAMIERMLENSGYTVGDLTALALSQGPGSYSGLRIGFGVAKGLSAARKLPLIAVPTLDIIASGTVYFNGVLLAVLQAGRGRIIAGEYHWIGDHWRADGAPKITSWQAIADGIATSTLINGEIDREGYTLVSTQPLVRLLDPAWRIRRAGFLAELAWKCRGQGKVHNDLAAINPIYLKGQN